MRWQKISEQDVKTLANWKAKAPADEEIPFMVARIVLQDFTGVPLLVDLAAMRAPWRAWEKSENYRTARSGRSGRRSFCASGFFGSADALRLNMDMEFERNRERYQFLKWGMQAFETFKVVPPGIGIVHQVNLEYLAKGVLQSTGETSIIRIRWSAPIRTRR